MVIVEVIYATNASTCISTTYSTYSTLKWNGTQSSNKNRDATCVLIYVAYRHAKDISDHSENSFIMFFDPQNIGLETFYVQLSLILAELWRKIDFLLMAALFCTLSCVSQI